MKIAENNDGGKIETTLEPGQESNAKDRLSAHLERALGDLDAGDAIGVIDVIASAIQRLEREEAIEKEQDSLHLSNDVEVLQETLGKGEQLPHNDDMLNNMKATAKEDETYIYATQSDGSGLQVARAAEDSVPVSSKSLRRRRKPILGKKSAEVTGIFGSTASVPFVSRFHNYAATVGSTQEKRVIAMTACAISIVGLFVALGFVTRDFLASKASAMTTVTYTASNKIELPDMYLCNRYSPIPPFPNQPSDQYPGEPLMWLPMIRLPGNASKATDHPNPVVYRNVDVKSVNSFGKTCTGNTAEEADPEAFEKYIGVEPECFFCFYIRNSPPIFIERAPSDLIAGDLGHTTNANRSLTVQLAHNGIVAACRNSRMGLAENMLTTLSGLITTHSAELQRRGILDFSNVLPTTGDNRKRLFPKTRMNNFTSDYICADVVDMICNTVLFAGYFYPSTASGMLSFKFNATTDHWARTGMGPYYPKVFTDMYRLPEPWIQVLSGKLTDLYGIKLSDADADKSNRLLLANSLQVYLNGSQNDSPLKQVAALEGNSVTRISFMRSDLYGHVGYQATTTNIVLHNVVNPLFSSAFTLHFTNKDFMTRKASRIVSVSVRSAIAQFHGKQIPIMGKVAVTSSN
jgi:hypothetical protein